MLRRLFFLFPSEKQAKLAVDELRQHGVRLRHIHAIANGVELDSLPEASYRQRNDTTFKLERFLWSANLLVFAAAFLGMVLALSNDMMLLSLILLVVAILNFTAGQYFVVRVPNVHLTEFTDALSHGEILLMVDVPVFRVAEIEHFVQTAHPEAVVGGVGWTMDAFGV